MDRNHVHIKVVRNSHEAKEAYNILYGSIVDAVGVDCEGTNRQHGYLWPLMVQAASPTVVVVEIPDPYGVFSEELKELLSDPLVAKVF